MTHILPFSQYLKLIMPWKSDFTGGIPGDRVNQYSKAGIPIIKGIKRFLNRGNVCRLDLEEQKRYPASPLLVLDANLRKKMHMMRTFCADMKKKQRRTCFLRVNNAVLLVLYGCMLDVWHNEFVPPDAQCTIFKI
jgi:hypothetical protein